ncbi:MAG: hypothetical protein FJ088_15815, partial [Deltaproteobacteria bacterium]|nr:hypothetical protein [Deltaproteobacteria bacterium]
GHSHQRVTELYSHLLPDAFVEAREAVSFKSPVGSSELEARAKWGKVELRENTSAYIR